MRRWGEGRATSYHSLPVRCSSYAVSPWIRDFQDFVHTRSYCVTGQGASLRCTGTTSMELAWIQRDKVLSPQTGSGKPTAHADGCPPAPGPVAAGEGCSGWFWGQRTEHASILPVFRVAVRQAPAVHGTCRMHRGSHHLECWLMVAAN